MPPEIRLDPSILYLNHAAVSPWPARAAAAVARFAEENMLAGSLGYPAWLGVERTLRARLARLVGAASPDDIALLKNTSEGLSVVAYGVDWRPGENVVGFAQEFPSNRLVWESLSDQGVEYRRIDLAAQSDPEVALIAACDRHTRVVSVSSVQYADGLRIDLPRIGSHCRAHGILFCVDAIQSLGALPFDVEACGADFVAADAHKWMMGPEGIALFYARPGARERLRLRQYGWHMVEHPGDYTRTDWAPSPTATRFECGSPNLLGAQAFEASLAWLEEVGIEEIARRVLANTDLLLAGLAAIPEIEVLSKTDPARRSGIVTFRPRRGDAAELHQYLLENRVFCAPRGGGVRFSPHFYQGAETLERAIAAVRTWCSTLT